MRTVIVLLAITLGCTPLCKQKQLKVIYHQECKEQIIDMGTISKPVCATHYEYHEVITEAPLEEKED